MIGQTTDTSRYYKVTGSSAIWSAYQLYMTKKIGEVNYIIFVSSDDQSKEDLIELITHIQESLIPYSQKSNLSDYKSKVPPSGWLIGYIATAKEDEACKNIENLLYEDFKCGYYWKTDVKLFKVFVGPFQTREEAEKVLPQIKAKVPDAYIYSENDESYATRKTMSYSIEYPKDWKVLSNPDLYTDVYLGDSQGKVGCTILFVDTDYSLDEIIEDGNTNMKNAGARVTSNKKLELNGLSCYKTIYEYSLGNLSVKQISYTFKKDNTMYNVKFGNNKQTIDANIALIDRIISSFKIIQ